MKRYCFFMLLLLLMMSAVSPEAAADVGKKGSVRRAAIPELSLTEEEQDKVNELQEKISNIRDLALGLYKNPSKQEMLNQLEMLNQRAVELHRSYPQLPIMKLLRYGRMIGFLRGDPRVVDDVRMHKFVIGGANYGDSCKICDGTGLCTACYGTGVCTLCMGSGRLRNPRGYFDSCPTLCKICEGSPERKICHRCRGVGALCNYTKLQSARGRMERELGRLSLSRASRYDYLGTLYYGGRQGFKRDPKRARELFGQAAKLDDPHALYMLSVMLRKGEGGKADVKRSDKLLARAADFEWPDAMSEMAMRGMKKRQYAQVKKWIYRLANPRHLGLTPVDPGARALSMARLAAYEYRNGSDYVDSDVLVDYPQTVRNAFAQAARQGELLARVWLLCDRVQNREYRSKSDRYSQQARIMYKYRWRDRIVHDMEKNDIRIVCIENFFIVLPYLIDNFSMVEFPAYETYKAGKGNANDYFDFFCKYSGFQWIYKKYVYTVLDRTFVKVPEGCMLMQGRVIKLPKTDKNKKLISSTKGGKYYFFMELLMLCNFIDNESDNYNFVGVIDVKELMVVREYGLWTIRAGMAIEAAEKRIEAEKAKEAPDEAAIKREQQLIREQRTIIDVCRVNANEVWIALHRKLKGEARVFSVSEPGAR